MRMSVFLGCSRPPMDGLEVGYRTAAAISTATAKTGQSAVGPIRDFRAPTLRCSLLLRVLLASDPAPWRTDLREGHSLETLVAVGSMLAEKRRHEGRHQKYKQTFAAYPAGSQSRKNVG